MRDYDPEPAENILPAFGINRDDTMICIATFYTYFGAMSFKKLCERHGVSARLMPVPRALSSSCGTCVQFEPDSNAILLRSAERAEETGHGFSVEARKAEELEQIAECAGSGYRILFRAEE